MVTLDIAKRFIRKVDVTPTCWNWTGHKDADGYGRFHLTKRTRTVAHRLSWNIFHGHRPPELLVLHKCDNPACVNPAHLFLGTQKENREDCVQKGRQLKGERHHKSKLSTEIAAEIRRTPRVRGTIASLARRYRVSETSIACVYHGKSWKG